MIRVQAGKLMRQRSRLYRTLLVVALTTLSTGIGLPPFLPIPPAQAQNLIERIQSLFTRKRDQGAASGRARGGSVRGVCPQIANLTLVPFSPQSNLGLTTEAHPTFLFYLPFGRTDKVTQAELLLLDKDEILGDPVRFELPETPGIVTVQLPAGSAPLELGKQYRWFFSIICKEDEPSINPFVSGWVQRVEPTPDLVKQLQALSPTDQYIAYVNGGIWYSAIDQLAQHRTVHPNDWESLLALFNLTRLRSAPVTSLRLLESPLQSGT